MALISACHVFLPRLSIVAAMNLWRYLQLTRSAALRFEEDYRVFVPGHTLSGRLGCDRERAVNGLDDHRLTHLVVCSEMTLVAVRSSFAAAAAQRTRYAELCGWMPCHAQLLRLMSTGLYTDDTVPVPSRS